AEGARYDGADLDELQPGEKPFATVHKKELRALLFFVKQITNDARENIHPFVKEELNEKDWATLSLREKKLINDKVKRVNGILENLHNIFWRLLKDEYDEADADEEAFHIELRKGLKLVRVQNEVQPTDIEGLLNALASALGTTRHTGI